MVRYVGRIAALLILLLVTLGLILAFGPSVIWGVRELPARAGPGDVERGAYIATIAGCGTCHTDTTEGARPYAGGRRIETPFGVFVAPNITPDLETGIGGWTNEDFVRALTLGLSPDGRHYYPAFPYTAYTRMTTRDLLDLKTYLDSLTPVANATDAHDLAFPYSIRPGLGLWKAAFFTPGEMIFEPSQTEAVFRGLYLAEGPAHCIECHTPRNFAGALRRDHAFAGTEDGPEGGRVPNLTPHEDGLAGWERIDLEDYLLSGLRPDGDFAGGAMAEVVRETTSQMTEADRRALAIYLLSLPERPFAGE